MSIRFNPTSRNGLSNPGVSSLPRCATVCLKFVVFSGIMAVVATAGCNRPLLTANDPRSPFEAYDTVRGQNPPMQTLDEFGAARPNLRGRLSPRD